MRAAALVFVAAVAVWAGAVALAQGEVKPSFAAASVKPVPPTSLPTGAGPQGPGLYSRPFATVQQLVAEAYEVPRYRIVGGPAWVTSDRFQVLAKVEPAPARGQVRPLVQQLLEERFQLRTHRELRELPLYNLVFARGDHRAGPGLRPAPIDCRAFRAGDRPMSESPTIEQPDGRLIPRCGFVVTWNVRTGATKWLRNGVPMEEFVAFLQETTLRDVHDQTGLTGLFDFDLTFVPPIAVNVPGAPQPNGDGPALTTALQEQLGLKLESVRGPVGVLVIDSVAHPSPD